MRRCPSTEREALAVFFRVPRLGAVKRRLARAIGGPAALEAYVLMLTSTFRKIRTMQNVDIFGFYEGDSLGPAWVFPGTTYIKQKGDDLGEKMLDAFTTLFSRGYRRVIIVGTDSPDLPLLFVDAAFDALRKHDVVIGPSCDGGYYLIGMSKLHAALFRDVPWGGPGVLAETMAKARAAGVSVSLLPAWYDIDDAACLSRWRTNRARLARLPG